MSDAERAAAIAACPTPVYHETHRYCPSCPWTEDDERPAPHGFTYRIHATFAIEAASADDAERAIRSALLDDDLAPSWTCERTWWTGEGFSSPTGQP